MLPGSRVWYGLSLVLVGWFIGYGFFGWAVLAHLVAIGVLALFEEIDRQRAINVWNNTPAELRGIHPDIAFLDAHKYGPTNRALLEQFLNDASADRSFGYRLYKHIVNNLVWELETLANLLRALFGAAFVPYSVALAMTKENENQNAEPDDWFYQEMFSRFKQEFPAMLEPLRNLLMKRTDAISEAEFARIRQQLDAIDIKLLVPILDLLNDVPSDAREKNRGKIVYRVDVIEYLIREMQRCKWSDVIAIRHLLKMLFVYDHKLVQVYTHIIGSQQFTKSIGRVHLRKDKAYQNGELDDFFNLLKNPDELGRFLFLLSLLRNFYFDGSYRTNGTGVAEYGVQKGAAFLWKGIRIIPTSDSFRRHVLLVRGKSGKDYWMEIKMPGEDKDRDLIHPWHFTLAQKAQADPVLRGRVPAPVAILRSTGKFFLYDRWIRFTKDNPLRIVLYEYDDGKRFQRIDDDFLNRVWKEYAHTEMDFNEFKIYMLIDIVVTAKALLDMGYVGENSHGNDWHMENFKITSGGVIMFVGDWGAFRRKILTEEQKKQKIKELIDSGFGYGQNVKFFEMVCNL